MVLVGASEDLDRHPRVMLGLWVRQMKTLWKIGEKEAFWYLFLCGLGVLLAPIFTMHESIPLEFNPVDYPLYDFVHSFNGNLGNGNQSLESKRSDI